jgi:hypothetical protein
MPVTRVIADRVQRLFGGFMRNAGLVERLDRSSDPTLPLTMVHQLDDVARALREVTDRNARTMRIKEAKKRVAKIQPAANDAEPALPQILQHPIISPETSATTQDRSRGQAIAPAILTVSLLVVAILMSASFTDMSRIPGLSWLNEKPRPRLTAHLQAPVALANAFDAGSPSNATSSEPSPLPPPISLDELSLLEKCESMIAAGDMAAARQELAIAANSGSVNARFALAETFDPNVLAAWGLRDRVADVGAARVLYDQAMNAGDPRAAARIAALGVEQR